MLKKIRKQLEKRIHLNEPTAFLPEGNFPWAKLVEEKHPQIKEEAKEILKRIKDVTNFDKVLPNQRALKQGDFWKSFFLVALDKNVPLHQEICPETTLALKNIPGVINAFFSILGPGVHIPPHRGPHAGILRYHLGVIIPEGDVAIKVDGQVNRWQEGKSLFFDDSFDHEAWNYTDSNRVILFVDVVRPLPASIAVLNRLMLAAFKLTKTARSSYKYVVENQIIS